jgi:hypothetical protein
MDSPAKKKPLAPNPHPPMGSPDGDQVDGDEAELRFFRRMAKTARRTTAKEIDRLFGPAE